MSPVSQTSPRRVGPPARLWLPLVGAPLVLALVLAPIARPVLSLAAQARPHAPDVALFAALSPAVKVHLLAALAALALGAALMIVRKGRTFHRVAGWAWVALVSLTAGSTLFITSLNHGRWSLLHLFTGWTLIVLPLAVLAARRGEVIRHRRHMMGLFYGGFAINLAVAFLPGRVLWRMLLG